MISLEDFSFFMIRYPLCCASHGRARPPHKTHKTLSQVNITLRTRVSLSYRVPRFRGFTARRREVNTKLRNPCVIACSAAPARRGPGADCILKRGHCIGSKTDSRAATHEPRLTRAKAESSSISLSVAFLAHLRPCSSCTNYNQQIFCIVVCEC